MVIERPKPIADQVDEIVRQRIRNRAYAPGGRLPSEQELADELGVSRATIRSVLAALAAERLIIRKQGDGTYVNKQTREVNSNLGGLWDFSNIIANSGRQATIRKILAERRTATTPEAARLNITPETAVLELVRLFLADNQPVVFSTNVIPINLLTHTDVPYEANLPLHKFLNQYCQQEIAYVISDISAVLTDPKVSDMLQRESGSPLLEFTEVFYNEDNQPLAFGVNYYDDKRLNLRLIQPWG